MFQNFQRRASRIGTTTQKVIVTIDLQVLELFYEEYVYPLDTLVSITLERGSKFSSSTEKEIAVESPDVNPLNKRSTSTTFNSPQPAISRISWNERLELVATLYKDNTTNTFQEKNCLIKLKIIQKGDIVLGFDKYQTVGKYSLDLHEIMNQLVQAGISMNSIMGPVYEREMKIVFQPFKKTSLQLTLRITSLSNQNTNAFNSFIYGVNNRFPGSHAVSHDDDDQDGSNHHEEASVSSYLSHDSDDIGFEYSDLRETRPVSSHLPHQINTPSKIIDKTIDTIRRSSLLPTLKHEHSTSSNLSLEEQALDAHHSSSSLGAGHHGADKDSFYSSYGVKDAASKLGRSRSMIVVGQTGREGASPHKVVASKSLSKLFPSQVSVEEEEERRQLEASEVLPAAASSPKLSPKSRNRKQQRKTNEILSKWMTAAFRTMAQELQRRNNSVERLENELHLLNQKNYVEKLELIQKLELLQREIEILKLPKPKVQKDRKGKDKESKKKKSAQLEPVPEDEDALSKTLQKTEETIATFKKSIDTNIQAIQSISHLRESLSSLGVEELYNAVEQPQVDGDQPCPLEEPATVPSIAAPAPELKGPAVDETVSRPSMGMRQSEPAAIGAMRQKSHSVSSAGESSYVPTDSSSVVSKYSPQEKLQLLEYELNHCRLVIANLERGRDEDQQLIREVADRVTENCLKRADSEWQLEKSRNQLIGYKSVNDQIKKEYESLQKKYLTLRRKMKQSMAKLTDLEVKYEYRNSLQDIRQLSDIMSPSVSVSEALYRPVQPHSAPAVPAVPGPPAHQPNKELAL